MQSSERKSLLSVLGQFQKGHIPEAEISIVRRCSLQCMECGFNVPNQPIPWKEPAKEIMQCIDHLHREKISIGNLALLGGEATLAPAILNELSSLLYKHPAINQLELVTNGLTPQGVFPESLKYFGRISISQYTEDECLLQSWERWIRRHSPETEVIGRRHKAWDRSFGEVQLDDASANRAFNTCWYRKHCVTLERNQLFFCSRIPKFEPSVLGLSLNESTRRQEIIEHLATSVAPESCKRCVPMAGLSQVSPGIQPDDRVSRLEWRALAFLRSKV